MNYAQELGTDIGSVTKEELEMRLRRGENLQLVNVVETQPSHELKLIKGSTHIPLSELDSRWEELLRTQEVILYCSSVDCNAAEKAANQLANKGFKVSVYRGGMKEWAASKAPLEPA